jgi:hypothetical protein
MVARLPKGWTGEEPVRPADVGFPHSAMPGQGGPVRAAPPGAGEWGMRAPVAILGPPWGYGKTCPAFFSSEPLVKSPTAKLTHRPNGFSDDPVVDRSSHSTERQRWRLVCNGWDTRVS